MSTGGAAAIAFISDGAGNVIEVLEDGIGVIGLREGAIFENLVAPGNRSKVHGFLTELGHSGSAFEWEVEIGGCESLTLLLNGARLQRVGYLVVGIEPRIDLHSVLDEVFAINNELVNAVRSLKEESTHTADRPTEGFEELSRLSNELVNVQRELAKRGGELSNSKSLIRGVLALIGTPVYVEDVCKGEYTLVYGASDELPAGLAACFDETGPPYHFDLEALLRPDDVAVRRAARDRAFSSVDDVAWEVPIQVRGVDGVWEPAALLEAVSRRDAKGVPTQIVGTLRRKRLETKESSA